VGFGESDDKTRVFSGSVHARIAARAAGKAGGAADSAEQNCQDAAVTELETKTVTGTFLRASTIKAWDRFRKFQDISPSEFVTAGKSHARITSNMPALGHVLLESNFKADDVVHFISHRWHSLTHPDPAGEQLEQIRAEFPDDALVWYDYCCTPQEPRTAAENELFKRTIDGIPGLISNAWFTVIGGNIESYATRSWCQFESMCALHYNSYPYQDRKRNEQTKWCMEKSPLYRTYVDCYLRLPRKEPTEGPNLAYVGGFFVDVPDLNDAAFAEFRAVFDQLQSSKLGDAEMLFEILRKLFPARTDDLTYIKY
jgi:hypothetical protein